MRNSRMESALFRSLILVATAAMSVQAQDSGGSSKSISWQTSYRQAADEAARDGKPVLVRVTASWCAPCQQMKQLTFTDSRVVELVRSNFVPLLIDADEQPDLVSGFRVEAYPTTIIVAPDLTILKRLAGYQSADSLATTLATLSQSLPETQSTATSADAVSALEPSNAVKYAFDGFCLVSLLEETRVRKGSVEFVAEHRGQMLCFETAERREKFLADPEKYWPVANGQCLVSSREGSRAGKGDPRMAVTWRGRIWMFSDRERQRRFIQTPSYYANEM